MNDKIAIISTVVNFELYSKTSPLFPKNINHYVIDGRNGMHGLASIFYIFKKLKNKDIDWLIMADEDVIFKNPEKTLELVAYMKKNNFQVSGVREGGIISHKPFNPYAINTFFSILHFSEIEKIFNKKEIKKNQYISPDEFKDDLSQLSMKFDTASLYEPYYCFYFWLKRKGFKFLYLNVDTNFPADDITTSVYVPDGNLLLHHTWYARAYGQNIKHTDRINNILESIPNTDKGDFSPIIFKDQHFGWKLKMKKNFTKIKMKLNK
ncbi:hypothetical protein [uncultured Christiangramia sp.]|uniref:hypothetical protein n=1 Tax=Christiangramia sp. 3-2217-3z TaxID=3417564 RepID=UPI0026024FFD|nr:hypothetical protein [uncultured Christiangramia sp.]